MAYGDMLDVPAERQPLLRISDVNEIEVYPVIQMIRSDIMHYIDTPLSYEALTSPDLTYTLVRPLEDKYNALQRQGNPSIVFCLLLNRVYFIRDQRLATASISRTRAALCEILAIRTLREHAHNMLELALVITMSWPVYSGAPQDLLQRARDDRDDDLEERVGNAIEMAILGQAKRFTDSSACQKVIEGIWSGKIVYQPDSTRSILSDTYKRTPIHFYDPHRAPLLDHYRLKVPAIRSVLEYTNFLVLFFLFIAALEFSELSHINIAEGVFIIYALGFTLEKVAAMQEHGIKLYFKGTWNGFDLAFVTLYCTYAILRLVGIYDHKMWARELGIDVLATIAVLMFPRLAFVTLKNNVMVLSLRAMIMQFAFLMLIAVFCFGGFLYAIWTFSRNQAGHSAGQIAWWMLDLWFGLDASLFDHASEINRVLGPITIVAYACLSNTLLLTVLVSMLSHTFSTINEDAASEAMFRRAVLTIEGVKADFLFSYQPPINLVALCIMLPASYILSPRWFHKVNVFMIRLTSFPILLLIAWYERAAKRTGAYTFYETVSAAAERVFDTLPRHIKRLTFFEGLSGPEADIDAIFEIQDELQDSALDPMESPVAVGHVTRQRRMSQASRRRASNRTATPPHSPQRNAQTIHNDESSNAESPPVPLPRHRLNSVVARGIELSHTMASPLAQIFQPLVFEEDNADDQQQDHHNPLVSYGPASRRRLSSMQGQNRPMSTDQASGHGAGLRRFPTASPRSKAAGLLPEPLSESPSHRSQASNFTPDPTETAEQLQEEGQPHFQLEKQLLDMEERQKRIEDMLISLTEGLHH